MPVSSISDPGALRLAFASRYRRALRAHLKNDFPSNHRSAAKLGRAALRDGLTTLDLAVIHEQAVLALATMIERVPASYPILRRAAGFFTLALRPLENAQHTMREASRDLARRNRILHSHAKALALANRRLESEVERRKAAVVLLRVSKERYRLLLNESRTMQKKLRDLTRLIIHAQEEERREISRELHDDVVQTLVGINVELAALGTGATVGLGALKSKIARTQRLVTHSVNAVHRFARGLRPAVLDDLGLIPALNAYAKSLSERKKLKIHLVAYPGVETLDPAKRTVLFRVAQEALTNVARHAEATSVQITIASRPDSIRMDVTDDGKSFAVEKMLKAHSRNRLGLVGMKERVEMVGGRFSIISTPGTGTTVRADIPLAHPRKNEPITSP